MNFVQIPQWYMRRVFRIIQHFEIVLHQEFVQRLGRVSLGDPEDMDVHVSESRFPLKVC